MAGKGVEGKVTITADTNKASNELKKFSENVKKTGENIGNNIKTLAIGFTALAGAVTGLSYIYGKQEQSEKLLQRSFQLTGEEIEKNMKIAKAWASQLQENSTVGDEVSLSMLTLAKQMGATTAEGMRIVETAADLSAGLGISLDMAVRGLTQTLSGQIGMFGRYVPALRELTEEQLKNGDAIDLLSKQYAGFAKDDANTFIGAMKQMGNTLGDVSEQFGSVFAPRIQEVSRLIKIFGNNIQESGGIKKALDDMLISTKNIILSFDDLYRVIDDNRKVALALAGVVTILISKKALLLAKLSLAIGIFYALYEAAERYFLLMENAGKATGLKLWTVTLEKLKEKQKELLEQEKKLLQKGLYDKKQASKYADIARDIASMSERIKEAEFRVKDLTKETNTTDNVFEKIEKRHAAFLQLINAAKDGSKDLAMNIERSFNKLSEPLPPIDYSKQVDDTKKPASAVIPVDFAAMIRAGQERIEENNYFAEQELKIFRNMIDGKYEYEEEAALKNLVWRQELNQEISAKEVENLLLNLEQAKMIQETFNEDEIALLTEHFSIKELLEMDAEKRITELKRLEYENRNKLQKFFQKEEVKGLQSFLGVMAAAQNSGSRTMFEIGKAAAIANASITAAKTVVDAYGWGNTIGGPVLGGVFAAAAAAAQAANIASIASQSYGGGGGGGSASGGGAVALSETPTQQMPQLQMDAERTADVKIVVVDSFGIMQEGANNPRVMEVVRDVIAPAMREANEDQVADIIGRRA
jgi:hypothetical protein